MLKTKLFHILFILAVSISLPAMAQETSAPQGKIAVIDMNVLFQKSLVMQDIYKQINVYEEKYQAEAQKEDEALRKAHQELARQRSILSAEAYAEERKIIDNRLAKFQRDIQSRRQELTQSRQSAVNKVNSALSEIVKNLAKARGIVVVLNRAQTVLSAPSLLITEDVLTILNEKLPHVSVPAPGK